MAKRVSNPQLSLKPQDLVVLLRLSLPSAMPTYAALADELGLGASEVHAAIVRAQAAQLVFKGESGELELVRHALLAFVLHGARYVFPAVRGEMTRGLPTVYAAPPLNALIKQPNELPFVWPDKLGKVRGMALYPLYPKVVHAAKVNSDLYELLVLFDALRAGSAREQGLAQVMLSERLGGA